jgi:hypothetical protein
MAIPTGARETRGASWRTFRETSFVQLGVATEGLNRLPVEMGAKNTRRRRRARFAGRCSLVGEAFRRPKSLAAYKIWALRPLSRLPVVTAMWNGAMSEKIAIHRLANRRAVFKPSRKLRAAPLLAAPLFGKQRRSENDEIMLHAWRRRKPSSQKSPQYLATFAFVASGRLSRLVFVRLERTG